MAVNMQVVSVVAFYMVAALVMVFVNKMVLNSAPNLTILFMFFQSLATILLLHFSALFSKVIDIPKIDLETARKLTLLMLVDAAGFAFNALCLRDVEAAFYQVARGLVLPLTIALSSLQSRNRPKLAVVACAAVVTIGFFMGVAPSNKVPEKATLKPTALLYGFLSALSIATHAVLLKASLPAVNNSSTALSYWCNLGAAVVLGVLALLKGEVSDFLSMTRGNEWDWTTFAWGNLVTGVFGFLISIAGILSVKITSPVTHMFSSAARSVLQVALGVRLFGDVLTTQRAASVFTILVGTLLFTWVKSRENAVPNPAAEAKERVAMKDLEAQRTLFDAGNEHAEGEDDASGSRKEVV